MTRKALLIASALATMVVCSCVKEQAQGQLPDGYGGISLRLDSGSALRLETKTDAEDLADRPRFNNVLVILENSSNKVAGIVYKEYPYEPGVDDLQDAEDASSVTEDVIHFDHLLPGTYNIYAYANIDAPVWQDDSALISAQEKVLSVGDDFSSFADRELSRLSAAGSDVPGAPSASMLLTGRASGVPIGLNVVDAFIDLLRPVVRFKVTIRNHTAFPVTVDDLHFTKFNPDKAYLLDHFDASGVPVLPSDVTYREMPAFDTSAGDDSSVAEDSEEVIYQRLIYENAYPGVYKVYTTLILDRSSEGLSNLEVTLGDNPFGVIDYAALSKIGEGEEIDVLVTNPQVNPRSGRIFAYISAKNYMAWESAGYNSFNDYFSRAQAIYNEVAAYTYSNYTSSSTYGYSAWDGVSANPKEDNAFDYTGLRSQYFHKLTKSGGLFNLEGLAVSNSSRGTVNGSSITGMRIEAGAVVKDKNPADVAGKLVRFIKNEDGKYLQANTNYNAGQPKQKEANLIWQSGGTQQDRQFMLFGKYMAGGLLKRMLKDNNKEVPLTYMSRNEDINVVLNVYYSDQEGSIDFVVDNSTWDHAGATTSEHTFN